MTRERNSRGREERHESKSVGMRGSAGIERADEEAEKAANRATKSRDPFRYKADWDRNALNDIIFLDDSIEKAFFFHEHNVQDADGNWGRKFEVCVKESDTCPLCTIADGDSKRVGRTSYAMALTVLDLRPYKKKNSKETVKHSKKLFVVKGVQVPDWIRTLQKAEKKFGTLRGVYMELGRSDKSEAATGKPLPLEKDYYGDDADDRPYAIIEEDTLVDDFGNEERRSDDKKRVFAKENEDIEPYDYEALFPYPDVDEVAEKYGAKSRPAGSKGDLRDDDWEKEKGRDRSRKRTRDEEPEEDAPRSRRRGREEPEETEEDKPRRRSRRDEPEEEADDSRASKRSRRDKEDEDDAPRARKRNDDDDRPAPPKRTRDEAKEEAEEEYKPRRSRKAKDEEPEEDAPRSRRSRREEPEDEEPTRRSRRSRASRDDEDDGGKGKKPF